MTVKELVEKLNKFSPDAEIACYYRAELVTCDEEFSIDAVGMRNNCVTLFGGV